MGRGKEQDTTPPYTPPPPILHHTPRAECVVKTPVFYACPTPLLMRFITESNTGLQPTLHGLIGYAIHMERDRKREKQREADRQTQREGDSCGSTEISRLKLLVTTAETPGIPHIDP